MLACVLLPLDSPGAVRRLFAVAPLVERERDVAFLDVSGTSRLHGGTAGLFAAIRKALAPAAPRGLALASNRFTAEVAARHGRGPVAVAAGEEALFLAHLPLRVLPLSDDLARRLAPLGLDRLGDFASLPLEAVEVRYGPEGVALHRLARGIDERGLLPERPEAQREVLRDLEHPASNLAQLQPVLEEALRHLLGALEERSQGVVRLGLTLALDAGVEGLESAGENPQTTKAPAHYEIAPASPEVRAKLLLDLLCLRLTEQPPAAAVTGLTLRVLESRALAVHQNALFGEIARDAARRTEALSRLTTAFGAQAVTRPRLRSAHRLEQRWSQEPQTPESCVEGPPGAGSNRRKRTTRRGRGGGSRRDRGVTPGEHAGESVRRVDAPPAVPPPLRLTARPVELVPILVSGRLTGFRRGREQLELKRLSRPRRLEGGWWREPWARDEFDLQTVDGAQYRICRDMLSRRWLLLGEVD